MRTTLKGSKVGIVIGLTGVLTFPITVTGVASLQKGAGGTHSFRFTVTMEHNLHQAREVDAASTITKRGDQGRSNERFNEQ